MKRMLFVFSLFYFSVNLFCYESTLKVKSLDFKEEKIPAYKNFYEHYGEIYLFYKETPCKCQRYNNQNGKFEKKYDIIIEELEYYYKKDNNLHYIGKINLKGIFDKNDNCIIPFPEIPENMRADGYSSEILEKPFHNAVIITENGSSRELDPYGYFIINYETNTFEVFNPFHGEE